MRYDLSATITGLFDYRQEAEALAVMLRSHTKVFDNCTAVLEIRDTLTGELVLQEIASPRGRD